MLGRNARDEFTMEEERAKFTVWESIADNLWDKYNYKILQRETQGTGKTLSKGEVTMCLGLHHLMWKSMLCWIARKRISGAFNPQKQI